MGVLDKMVAAVTPEPSDEDRAEVRQKLRAQSNGNDWVGLVLDHHLQIEDAFAAVRSATSDRARRAAQQQLALVLTGHSLAEEVVLYPAMALGDQKGHSTAAYTEQAAAKVQLAALDYLAAMSQDYLDKLEHLRAAVSHHMYEEEKEWFPELSGDADTQQRAHLTERFAEEYRRYVGGDLEAGTSPRRTTAAVAQAAGA